MTFLGVALRRPSFDDITFSVAFATAILVAYVVVVRLAGIQVSMLGVSSFFAGSLWGAVSQRIGISVAGCLRQRLLFFLGLVVFVVCPALIANHLL
ncbi:hypothetical protein [Burkholderia lata]|uniref:hypothetical protein n=1 Tax=Burkholderia lata (strain ATCC 17760 / DSM 23089 / LMG 22485 / NCIMB 9086 / R18194 / 383) TaxID=482957 RepID=UPI0015818943|nr:hypothetical protein [Burkholderia lata]